MKVVTQHYRDRSHSMAKAASDLHYLDTAEYGDAIALLAVHSAIAMADALATEVLGRRYTGQRHIDAVAHLRDACNRARCDDRGVRHLTWLLSRKDRFAYQDRPLHPDKDVRAAYDNMVKFIAWAYATFPELAKETRNART